MAKKNNDKVSVIPLGGVGEIGKNMTVVECNGEIVVVDCGVMFPDEDMLGIDLVIPDFTYLLENRDRVRGILLTHGHEDHIGALPYVLRELNVPVYGTRLTLALVEEKLRGHGLERSARLHQIKAGQTINLGPFTVDFVHVNHSIADVVALAIHTPQGVILFASDFKFDQTPIDGRPTDFHKLTELGNKGVVLLLSDSTNAENPGYTLSEKVVGETFKDVFRQAKGRILVATFASNIHRIQQIVDAAYEHGRKVAVIGRSMVNVVGIASELGYLQIPPGVLIEIEEIDQVPLQELVIITTGSQGEPMSALTRMAMSDHRRIEIVPGDTVILSSSPIPGNEKLVGRTINHLFKQGAEVIYHSVSGVHVSGHASQEELKLMINLCRPKYFLPVHGEYRMLVKHARLAEEVGVPRKNIFICDPGDTIEISKGKAYKGNKVPSGQILVDGLGVGDVGNIVLRDRRLLAKDGILIVVLTIDKVTGKIVAGPDIVSRGFVYMRESEKLIEEARERVKQALSAEELVNVTEWGVLKDRTRETLNYFLYERTKRRPMILPIIMEV
ncbi:MAG: ribonuclease J [Limnochordia bacterium]|jgi:ribonuclease J